MRLPLRALLISVAVLLCTSISNSQIANHVVIAQVAPMNGSSGAFNTGEFIELYNPTASDVTFGPSVILASGKATSGSNAAEWQISLSGKTIRAFSYFLIADGGLSTPTPELTFPASKNLSNSGIRAAVAILDGATTIDAVGWDPLLAPQLTTEGTRITPSSTSSDGKSFERKSSASAVGHDNFGNGYDSGNNATDFFENTAANKHPLNASSPSEVPYSGTDTIPPVLVSLLVKNSTQIELTFNEAVDSTSASNALNYTIDNGISVLSTSTTAKPITKVMLTTSTIITGAYTLTVNSVKDTTGNALKSPQSMAFSYGTLPIALARALGAGASIRVRGTITAGNEFASPSYIQDSTGGLAVFNSGFSTRAHQGDLWEVAGTLKPYNGLLEIDPLSDSLFVSSGNPVPKPLVVSAVGLDSTNESKLVRINKVKFALSGTFGPATADSNYYASNADGTLTVRVDKDSNIPGSPIPSDSVNLEGIVNVFNGFYRLLPRSSADIGVSDPVVNQTWTDMSVARNAGVGTSVKVRGVVTFASGTTHKTVYFQDATGGLSVYDPKSDGLSPGDSIEVVGTMTSYSGLQEIQPADTVTVLASGVPLPTPMLMLPGNAGEYYESRLVILHAVEFTSSGTFAVGSYTVTDGSTSAAVYVATGSALIGLPIPVGAMDLIGVLGQHTSTTGGYQVLPRTTADFIQLPGPQIEALPSITALTDTSVTLSWTTLVSSNSVLSFGSTKSLGDSILVATPTLTHAVTLGGLTAGRICYLRASSSDSTGTSTAPIVAAVTTSSASTDSLAVYFNYSVDTSLPVMPKANGSVRLDQKLLQRINAATKSIDFALYSFEDFSSNANQIANPVADALIAARGRGVAVRMVTRLNYTSGPVTKLQVAGIPIMKRNVPELGSGMHSKFWIFDGRDTTSATDDWVITGSWNVTNTGTLEDAQNAVFIQDQSLARIYESQFEQMFGSSTETPNASSARFGPTKLDDAPHLTFLHGMKVEVYFSPSDHTTSQILRTINTADKDLLFALLTFTRTDLSGAAVARKSAGASVHGIIDNINDNGSQFSFLVSSGTDTRQANHSIVTGQFHHKYAVVDPGLDASDPVVVTGSHNWSSSAETDNDENTIILHSGPMARQYAQEFSQRVKEAGGSISITGVVQTSASIPTTTQLEQNYPNPFNPATAIRYAVAAPSLSRGQTDQWSVVSLQVYDMLGRVVATLVNMAQAPGTYQVTWNASSHASGIYFVRMVVGEYVGTRKMILLK